MVIFNNWTLLETGGVLAYQYDNKTRVLLVSGDLPDGWTWDMLVSVGDNLDIIRLSPMEGGVGVVLTAEMLALPGYYVMQLRGTQGELVRHTNQMTVFIPPSLSGDANWPEIPSEFTQLEQRVNEAAEHYPQIGEDATWLTYDVESGAWKDTGVSAVGQKGEPGEPGGKGDTGATPNLTIGTVETLEAGSDATASITGTVEDPILNLGIPRGENGGGGVQSDWNVNDDTDLAYVKNRPCYEETITEITWDGNTERLEMVEISIDGETGQIYKVSDLIIPSENFVNATVTARMFGGDYDKTTEISVTLEDISEQNGSIVILGGYICVISDENIGSPGLYFVKATQNIYTVYIGGIVFDDAHSSITIPLAEKFLPAIAKPAPITEGWVNLIWKPSAFCVTFSAPEEFSISVAIPGWDGTMEYSTDTVNWNKWDGSKVSGSSLHFRGIGNTQITGIKGKDSKWTLEGENITCSGNIELLLDCVTVAAKERPNMGKYCYEGMFYGCTGLVSAPTLPAAAATLYCYAQMFYGCTSLTSAPELPATTLANFCYRAMFNDCKALVAAPELPATTAAQFCYAEMFSGCKSLKTVPELPANITAYACYYKMFYGCNNLMTVPKLSAVTLEYYCYEQMFAGCSKIRLSASQSDSYTWEYRIPAAGSGTLKTDALDSMFTSTGGTFTGTPEINTTYYLHKDCTIV